MSEEKCPPLPSKKSSREVGKKYHFNGKIRIWDGKILRCEHNRQMSRCKDCSGGGLCKHSRQRSRCVECDGSSICEHGRQKTYWVECGGSGLCEHGRQKWMCVECGGGNKRCRHDRQWHSCKECGGSSICEHKRERAKCKECGGASVCEHGRIRSTCIECGGGSVCEHKKLKRLCMTCDPNGALSQLLRSRVREALKGRKVKSSTTELLGCSIKEFRRHLEKQFKDGMSWDNHGKGPGKWNIDHDRPCASFNLLKEEHRRMCFHYTNQQPMWATENLSKNSKFDEESFNKEWNGKEWVKKVEEE